MNITKTKKRSAIVNPLAVIDRIIADLELSPTQYKEATDSYNAVAAALQKLHPTLSPTIQPHGSMRAGTTVRPLRGERFDLDMICRLLISGKLYSPEQVYNLVWEALGQDDTYRHMRRRKNCCIRLEGPPEKVFYLDVTPAVPDWAHTSSIYVPDRERKVWKSSHPIAFCDEWFLKSAETLPTIRQPLLNRAELSGEMVMANASYVEPMPEFGDFEKMPLQRIVQMLKRDRDEYYQSDETHRPSSILLTTIITQAYSSLVGEPVGDLLEFVVKVAMRFPQFIRSDDTATPRQFFVMNPVNPGENFAKSWTDEHHVRFHAWHDKMIAGLKSLQQSKGRGVDVMLNSLAENFGNERVIKAASALGADTSALHEAGKLRLLGGAVGAAGVAIPKTIYYGNAK
jgi:hypothetical protein